MGSGPLMGQSQPRFDFSEYLDGLYGYAMVLSRNRTEADDLVQETCVRALRGMSSLRTDGNVKSWLFTILRNTWLNQVRQHHSTPEIVELDGDGSGPNEPLDTTNDPYGAYVNALEQQQVRRAIQKLPVEFREIIILREYEDLSYQEIATLLHCAPGTVMSRLARARSRLRELLSLELVGPRPSEAQENDAPTGDGTAA